MDTSEHTELGDSLRFGDWDELQGNPYVRFNEQGTLLLELQGINENGLPEGIDLEMTAGQIMAMSGDYFGGREVELDLPSQQDFARHRKSFQTTYQCEDLGEYLVKKPVTATEEQKLVKSYQKLANSNVNESDIETIYKINNANYIPFSSTLNSYVQQLMFALRVNNYSEILNRNLSHFTPWSVRVYMLGHHIALKYGRISYELNQLIKDQHYQSDNQDFNSLIEMMHQSGFSITTEKLKDLAYRYQALALGMELFCFHYYSDHYAAGHGAMMGDLRVLLPARFGTLGSILVNNLHDELNQVTVYTKRPYDPTPDLTEPPVETGGDGDFNSAKNYYNKQSCIAGLQESMEDIRRVFQGNELPSQIEYGGLQRLPDIDVKYRQPQPLFLLGEDNKIYYRTELSKIHMLSPSDFRAAHASPQEHGYTELSNIFEALLLVTKLRLLSYFYQGKLQTLTADELSRIEQEEAQLNPGRQPIPQPPLSTGLQPVPVAVTVPHWQRPASNDTMMHGLNRNGLLASSKNQKTDIALDITEDVGFTL
ncbi:hypothetical protein [Legionella maioricensis]|uniref:Dot/Icm secretion system substrate n=1 Tax=Legionella maioricensis TaxID=2896528 RepID=A0A9X2D0U2_9GAMM|nr:hypothetical protein [Legionella maioricensis]MCL9684343.1 hypothetical protein [Legionella maioricensis]MCL9688771.1 hypothetical protein [Legionella maioricensis]